MSRKDYELIAGVFARNTGPGRDDIARAIAAELLNTNPRFDFSRFLAACGVNQGKASRDGT